MVDAVLGIIGTLSYPLFSIIFLFLNILQSLFYSFAGIGNIQYGNWNSGNTEGGFGYIPITGANDGGETSTGIVYFLLTSDIVKNIFISILILALFLLVIFTTMAFIKNIYAEKPKDWREIITNAIKGLTNFIVLPVVCLLGVWLGNIVLQAVNGATSTSGTVYLDRKLFICSAYNANVYRTNTFDEDSDLSHAAYLHVKAAIEGSRLTEIVKEWVTNNESGDLKIVKELTNLKDGQNSEYYADMIDKLFSLNVISIINPIVVGSYYQLWNINYLLLLVGGIFMMYVMVNVTFGMVKRMFILLMLFVVSPALCAMYPLDDGAAVKSWSGDVKKNVLSAYGAVAGMNLFFSFAPIIQNINVASNGFTAALADISFISTIIQLLVLICGLFCVNDFINMISGYIGAGNAFSDGKSLAGQVKGAWKKYGATTVKKGFTAFHRASRDASKAEEGGKAAAFFSSLGKQAGVGVLNAGNKALDDILDTKSKEIDIDTYKSGDAFKKSGLGQMFKDESKKWDEADIVADNKKRWANATDGKHMDESEFETTDENGKTIDYKGAAYSDMKRRMMADGISEEDAYKNIIKAFNVKGGESEVKNTIAEFEQMDYAHQMDGFNAVRPIINSALSGETAADRDAERKKLELAAFKQGAAGDVYTTGNAYIDAMNGQTKKEDADEEDLRLLTAVQHATFEVKDHNFIGSEEERDARIMLGENGKYTTEEMRAVADPALIRNMQEFNNKMDNLIKAQQEQTKVTEDRKKADEEATRTMEAFAKAMEKAKSINDKTKEQIEGFGDITKKSAKQIEEFMATLKKIIDETENGGNKK